MAKAQQATWVPLRELADDDLGRKGCGEHLPDVSTAAPEALVPTEHFVKGRLLACLADGFPITLHK